MVAAALATGGFGAGAGWWLYDQGRTAEHADCLAARMKASAERDKALRRAFAQADRIAKQDLDVATASNAERIRVIEEIRYEYRAAQQIKTPDCRDLGADWLRLYNRGIAAANGLPGNAGAAESTASARTDARGAQR